MNDCKRWVHCQRTARGLLLLLVAQLGGCDSDSAPPAAADPAPIAGTGLRLQNLLGEGEGGTDGFIRAAPNVSIGFPADHGPHPGYRSEWWYLTLMLEDAEGQAYGGQFTVFRQALQPPAERSADADNPWSTSQVYLAHLAMTDAANDDHRFAERFARGQPQLAGARAAPFAVWLEDWRLASVGADFLPLQLTARAPQFAWSLTLSGVKPLTLQGEQGFSAKGPGQGSHYYSATRLQVSGVLTIGAREVVVQGGGWLDREWSTSVLSPQQVGWDWFALQLDDGRDLMMFNLRRADCSRDPFDHGVMVAADGQSRLLKAADFELTPVAQWLGPGAQQLQPVAAGCGASESSRVSASSRSDTGPWPLEWRVQVGAEQFVVRAAVLDQRMQTTVRYWEGLVDVFAAADPDTRVGRGYMELTGY